MKNDYNGWTNEATWNINVRYEEIFADMAENQQDWDDVECLADAFQCLIDELEVDILPENSFSKEIVGKYLNEVNWTEIAEFHLKNEISDEDADLMQAIADSLESNH